MKFTMRSPCEGCPFVRTSGFTFAPGRVREFESTVGGGFPCHKTTKLLDGDEEDGYDVQHRDQSNEVHCAGSLIMQWKEYAGFDGFVAWVLSHPDGTNVPKDWKPATHLNLDADVFDSFDEMARATSSPRTRARNRQRPTSRRP